MSRGYVHVDEGGRLTAVRALQGRTDELDDGDSFWGADLRGLSTEPGLHRIKFSVDGRWHSITLGKQIKSALAEAERLHGNAARQRTFARTSSPGAKGYQEAETAATVRLQNLKHETLELAAWLERLPRPKAERLAEVREKLAVARAEVEALEAEEQALILMTIINTSHEGSA